MDRWLLMGACPATCNNKGYKTKRNNKPHYTNEFFCFITLCSAAIMAITVNNALENHCDEQPCEVNWLDANRISVWVSAYGSLKTKEKFKS